MGYKGRVTWRSHDRHLRIGGRKVPSKFRMFIEPDDDESGPTYELAFEFIEDVPQCREVRIVSAPAGREVRRADMQLSIEDHLEWAVSVVSQPYASSVNEVDVWVGPFLKSVRQARRSDRRRGPTDDELRKVSEVHASAGRATTQAVAEHFGIAHRTASLWIKRSRESGYL